MTPNNNIPYVPENTTDPAAGLNLSLNVIDALLQVAVVDILNAPPGSPAEGARYLVGTAGTGAFSGHSNQLARYLDGGWFFYDARMVVNLADGNLYIRDGSGWGAVTGGGGGGVASVTGTWVDNTDPANPEVVPGAWPGRAEASTAFTLDSDDMQQLIETTGTNPVVTIPTEASDDLGSGFVCYGIHHGSGSIGFSTAGVTLLHPDFTSPAVPGGSPWTLVKSRTAANTWFLFGGLEQAS